jgi:hypothetical protein
MCCIGPQLVVQAHGHRGFLCYWQLLTRPRPGLDRHHEIRQLGSCHGVHVDALRSQALKVRDTKTPFRLCIIEGDGKTGLAKRLVKKQLSIKQIRQAGGGGKKRAPAERNSRQSTARRPLGLAHWPGAAALPGVAGLEGWRALARGVV